jgi:hypothetical protein
MSSQTLAELLAQHRALEAELADAIAHPASTDAEIAAIKRQKLKLKDLIARKQADSGTIAA